MSDPIRLKDDPQAVAAMRDDLERVHCFAPRAYDTDAGLARLHSTIAAPSAGVGLKAALWPWVTAGLVSAMLLVYAVKPSDRSPRTPSVAKLTSPASPSAAPVSVESMRSRAVEAPPIGPQPTVVHEPAEQDPDARLRLETTHLARARQALQQSPARALRLAQQGERRFVGGMFGQERQAIIVLSSLRLQHASAPDAARHFLSLYPHSPLADRIREALDHLSEVP